jgi:DNA-binding IclR family transcriptional regulator
MPTTTKARTPVRAKQGEIGKKSAAGDQYLSRAVGKALEALELLQPLEAPMALHEIAKRIQLSKTSAFRLLRTLESAGYLGSNAWGQYFLVPEIRSVMPTQFLVKLLRTATPPLRELNRDLRESVSLAALFENHSEVILVMESPEVIRMSNVTGHILPPNASALGKVITAFQREGRGEKLVRSYGLYRFTPQTIIDEGDLAREYETIRKQGFALDREESVSDGCCFAVPIPGQSGDVAAAISASIPKVRIRGEAHEQAIVEALRATAANIRDELIAAD